MEKKAKVKMIIFSINKNKNDEQIIIQNFN